MVGGCDRPAVGDEAVGGAGGVDMEGRRSQRSGGAGTR
jgi:hypothetical protein